jgi:hypothetical protein
MEVTNLFAVITWKENADFLTLTVKNTILTKGSRAVMACDANFSTIAELNVLKACTLASKARMRARTR